MRLVQAMLWFAVFTAIAIAQPATGALQAERGGRGGQEAGMRSVEMIKYLDKPNS